MSKSRIPAFAAGAVVALVLGSSTAYAATGGTFILGKANSAGRTTSLASTQGSALELKAPAGRPALQVSNGVRVPRLNADKVDGLDASAFARTTGRTGVFDASGVELDLDENGYTDAIGAAAVCPPGTQMTGGGGSEVTSSGMMFVNAPDAGESWLVVVAVDETVAETAGDVTASVVCYNPRGGMRGSYRVAGGQDVEDLGASRRGLHGNSSL